MSLTQLNIPKKIKIGYQKREDTYTGMLAYVIYYDHKGKLRKERSWQGWRDEKIEPDDYDNEPTEGFVLNKKVGGHSWGWNPRRTMVRVYDPRGFEFEITVPNLLFILEECSSIKGKGLEGQFVYALDGTDLILLPVTSQEYRASSEFTSLQTMKITKKDMVPGCWYTTKDDEDVMYLGREEYHETYVYYPNDSIEYLIRSQKLHIFLKDDSYWTQKGFTKLAKRNNTEPDPSYAEKYDRFKKSLYGDPDIELVYEPVDNKYGFVYLNNNWYRLNRNWRSYTKYEAHRVEQEGNTVLLLLVSREFVVPKDLQRYRLFIQNKHGQRKSL